MDSEKEKKLNTKEGCSFREGRPPWWRYLNKELRDVRSGPLGYAGAGASADAAGRWVVGQGREAIRALRGVRH